MKPQKLELDLGFAKLVVEVYNSDYPVPEVCVCFMSKNDMQDIACIRQTVNDNGEKQDAVDLIVYADHEQDDYTHNFLIKHYKYEKGEVCDHEWHCKHYGVEQCDKCGETREIPNTECPLGGDTENDCADCDESCDHHFANGDCIKR
jgi:hypothetical protein